MIALWIALAVLLLLLIFPFRVRAAVFADLLQVEAEVDVSVLFLHIRRKLVFAQGEFYLCNRDTATRLLFRGKPSLAGEAAKKTLRFTGGWVVTLTGQEDLSGAVALTALLKAAGGVAYGLFNARGIAFSALSLMNFSPEPVLRLHGSVVIRFRLCVFVFHLCAGLFARLTRRHRRQIAALRGQA